MALLFRPKSAVSGVRSSSLMSQPQMSRMDDEQRKQIQKQQEEDEKRGQREAALRKSEDALAKRTEQKEFQNTMQSATYAPGTKPIKPLFSDIDTNPVEVEEDRAVLDTLGGKSVEYTPNAQKLIDIDRQYGKITEQIKGIEKMAKPSPSAVKLGARGPDPVYLQKKRDALIANLYEVEKQAHQLSSTMTPDDFESINRADELYKRIYETNKKSIDARNEDFRKVPGGQAIGETLTEPPRALISLFGIVPGIVNRVEMSKKGRTKEEQRIIVDARASASAPQTIAGNTSAILSNIGKFGLEAYATAGLLSKVPVLGTAINAGKAAPIAGGTARLLPTVTQNIARGGLVFGGRETAVQTAEGLGYDRKKIMVEAAAGAVFEGLVAPALGKVWRKSTTTDGGTVFVMRPNEGGIKSLPAPGGSSFNLPKSVKEVAMKVTADVKGLQRRMVFTMDDGNIYDMVYVPQGNGDVILQISKSSPNWLKQNALSLIKKFNGEGGKEAPIDAKAQQKQPDLQALIKQYGSEDNIPLDKIDAVEAARVRAGGGLTTSHTTIGEIARQYNSMDDFMKGMKQGDSFYVPVDQIRKDGIDKMQAEIIAQAKTMGKKFTPDPVRGDPTAPLRVGLKDGQFNILDGHHRFIDALNKGATEVLVQMPQASDDVLRALYEKSVPSALNAVPGLSVDVGQFSPAIVDVPTAPILPEPTSLTTIGVFSVKQFLGGQLYTSYKPYFEPSAREHRLLQFRSEKPPEVSGGSEGKPKIPALSEADKMVAREGGYAAIKPSSSLAVRNAYGSQELSQSMGFDRGFLYDSAMEGNVDLSQKLKEFDAIDGSEARRAYADKLKKELDVIKVPSRSPEITLYRGVGAANLRGNYASTDKEFARNFTQSGQDSEISEITMKRSEIYRPSQLPSAVDEKALDAAITNARAQGFSGVFVNEGPGQPESVFMLTPQTRRPEPKKPAVRETPAKALRQFSDDPEIEPIRKELEESTSSLEEIVASSERQIAEVNPQNESAGKLVNLAEEIRGALRKSPQLPGGVTRAEFFQELAASGDSVTAISKRLSDLAAKTQSADVRSNLEGIVKKFGSGTIDDIDDFVPFQEAIVSGKAKKSAGTLTERANRVIKTLGDFEVEQGVTMTDVLNEIDMLESQLHGKIAERTGRARRTPEEQAAFNAVEGTDEVPGRAQESERPSLSGRELIKAIETVSKVKAREFRVQMRDAVSQAKAAQKSQDRVKFVAATEKRASIKSELIKEIQKRVPPERRGKFLAAVKNTETRKNLEKALRRVDKEVDAASRKEAIGRLKDLHKMDLNGLRPEYRDPVEQLINSVDPVKRTAKTMESALRLADYLAKEPDNQIPESRLNDLSLLAKKRIDDLTTEEINDLTDSIAHLVHLNTIKNKLLIRGKLREFSKVRREAIDNVINNHELKNGSISGLDSMQIESEPGTLTKIFTVDSYNAELKAEILDGKDDGVIRQTIYDGIDAGVTEELRLQQTAEDFFKERLGGIDMSRWSYAFQPKAKNVDKVSVKISRGRTVTMSKGERVAFLLHNMNPQNRKHLIEGGFSFPNTPSKIISLTDDDLSAIEASATKEEQTVVRAINEYFNTIQKDAINAVSVRLNGHEIAREKNYFPIRTSFLDRFHDDLIKSKNYSQKTLEGMGIFKARQNASNALIVEDAFTALYKSIKQTSAYVGLAEPLRSAKMLLNDNEFQISARTAGRNHYVDSLKKYLERIEGDSVNVENVDKLTYDLINKLDVAALGLNPFTMLKQPISYLNAATELEYKYLRASARRVPTVEDMAEMRTHSPQLRDRMAGNVTREAGEIAEVGAAKRFFTGENLLSQKFTSGLERFDRMSITRIWNAVKMEVKAKNPDLSGDAYWKAVADRTEMIVRRTQSTSHVKDRSTIGMTKNVAVKMFTRFSSERNKAYQQIRRSAERYNRSEKTLKDKANFANTLLVVLVVTPLIAVGIDTARDKLYGNTKKHTLMSTAADVVSNALGSVYFLGTAYDSLVSKLQNGTFGGYDVGLSAIDYLNSTVDTLAEGGIAVQQAITGEKYKSGVHKGDAKWTVTAKKFVFDALKTVAQLKGIPTTPIRMTEAVLDRPSKAKSDTGVSGRGGGTTTESKKSGR